MNDKSYNIRVPKRWARIAMIATVTALIVAPLTAIAAHTFNDVPDSHTFHEDIAWLEASGVTKGCNPPTNDEFCPDDEVTRGQMAAFMNRFAGYIGAEDGTPETADSVNGVTINRFFHQAASGTTDEEIGTWGPVTLYATCDGAGIPTLRASWNEEVNHMSFQGPSGQTGNASVDPNEVIGIGSGQFGSVGLAEAVGFDTNTHTSVEFFLRDAPALGDNACFYSGLVSVG